MRLFDYKSNHSIDELSIIEYFPNYNQVIYKPSDNLIDASILSLDDKIKAKELSHILIDINCQDNYVSINPINTLSTSHNFLKPKYEKIKSIVLEGFDYTLPNTIEEVLAFLEELPIGFIKDYEYGLGLQKDYRFIINAIENIPEVNNIVISSHEPTGIENNSYIININDFEFLKSNLDSITEFYRSESRNNKYIYSYNQLLFQLDEKQFPEKKIQYKKDIGIKTLSNFDLNNGSLSENDSVFFINIIENNKKTILRNKRKDIINLQMNIELANLECLILQIDNLLSTNANEYDWQKIINDNPLILTLVFGYPVIKINQQVTVGGRKISGEGDKVTDFLIKNKLTNNCAIVEIKKPSAKLLNKKEYRESVYAPSFELSGSITQILDQKYKFQKEISIIKDNSGIYDIESFSVDCLLIIGMIPQDKEEKKSFELFRHNLHDVIILTFDEIISKLKNIYLIINDSK